LAQLAGNGEQQVCHSETQVFRGSQCDEVTKKIQDSSVLRRLLSVKVSVDAIIC